jgi:hypothetical protein
LPDKFLETAFSRKERGFQNKHLAIVAPICPELAEGDEKAV